MFKATDEGRAEKAGPGVKAWALARDATATVATNFILRQGRRCKVFVKVIGYSG